MKVVNDGVPEIIHQAILNDEYDAGDSDYTPSTLNEPAYMNRLKAEFKGQISIPATRALHALDGTATHKIIELAAKAYPDRYIAERRFYGTIDTRYGEFKVGSQVDVWDRERDCVIDAKKTSVYAAMKPPKAEWTSQLNVGRWCVREETGHEIDRLFIMPWWRDWSASAANGKPPFWWDKGIEYPRSMTDRLIPIDVWGFDETESWMRQRIEDIEFAKRQESLEDVYPCTNAEMWADDDKFQLWKLGNSRSSGNYDTLEAAHAAMKDGQYVKVRQGRRKRCEQYCDVSSVCPVYRDYVERKDR